MTIDTTTFASPTKREYEETFESPQTPEPAYGFRDKTNEQTRQSKEHFDSQPTPKKSRVILTENQTASTVREKGHNCDTLNTANVAAKVAARLLLSLERFALSHAYNCETTRGTTHLNGASSTCGGCHAAHAALSGKLYDNIVAVVRNALETNRLDQLDVAHKGYLNKRFKLSEEDKENLASENQDVRLEAFDAHAKKLTGHEKRMTFSGTILEFQRSSTFDNPIFSNHFDSYIELYLRPKEDELNKDCATGLKTPLEALVELQKEYKQLVEIAISSLSTDIDKILDLYEAWNELLEKQKPLTGKISKESFEAYLGAVDRYLETHEARFKQKSKGTATLESLQWYLKDHQSPAILEQLQANRNHIFYKTNRHHLKIPADSDEQFAKAEKEIKGRLSEALYQLDSLQNSRDKLKELLKFSFGKADAKTPDKTALAEHYNGLIPRGGKEHTPAKKRPRDLPKETD